MKAGHFWDLKHVSDRQLRGDLSVLLASGSRTEARIIAHIAAVEERKLHLREGSPSLFDYCVRRLGLSESEAFHRITAARIARLFPIVFNLIDSRQIHLTAVCLLRDYLTQANHQELLSEASGKTKLQVQELLARRFPRPDVRSYVRKLPCAEVAKSSGEAGCDMPTVFPAQPADELASVATQPELGSGNEHASPPILTQPQPPTAPVRARVEPTSGARYRIQLNASASLKEKLELFQALVSHSNPSGDVAVALERALDLAIEQAQKQRFAKTDQPRAARGARRLRVKRSSAGRDSVPNAIQKRPSAVREHIPNAVQRTVAERDALQCAFVSESGCRCSARAFLQIHHEHPWARGGESSPDNLRLLCAAHNRLLAERDFGVAHVHERVSARRAAISTTARATASARAEARNTRRDALSSQAAQPSLGIRSPEHHSDRRTI